MARFQQGLFKPTNPDKYVGDVNKIRFMSSWELKLFRELDSNPNVLSWGSEEIVIPYISPVDNRPHRYYPDIVAKLKKKDGTVETMMIEVKPFKQLSLPPTPKKQTRQYINEVATFAINTSKWKAAKAFCDQHGWKFVIMTEKELGI